MSERVLLVLIAATSACARDSSVLRGTVGLDGEGVVGVVRGGPGGCGGGGLKVGLWGERWGTDGEVPAEASEEEPGVVWVYFPLMTGLGEGEAALRLQGREARLPLGARPGEIEAKMRLSDPPDAARLEAVAAETGAALERERAAWEEGRFLLKDGELTVGDLQIRGERAAVSVYDASWLAPEPVEAILRAEGADLVLSFPIEPSFEGEPGLLRINVPTRVAVVPAEVAPTELDRRLHVEPGEVPPAVREALVEDAIALADGIEVEQAGALARKLAAEARAPDGRCVRMEDLDPEWALLLVGYDVAVEQAEDGASCVVELSPRVTQHGRRHRGRHGPEGARQDARE